MSSPLPLFPDALQSRFALDEARRTVDDVARRLGDLCSTSSAVAADAQWHAPSAQAFGDRVDRWRRRLVGAQAHAHDVRDALTRAAATLDAEVWTRPR